MRINRKDARKINAQRPYVRCAHSFEIITGGSNSVDADADILLTSVSEKLKSSRSSFSTDDEQGIRIVHAPVGL